MQGFFLRAFVTMLAVLVAAHVVPGMAVDSWVTALGAGLVLGLLNATLRPLLLILSLPFIVVTLGLFIVVVNTALLGLAAWLVPGFHVAGFWSALFGSVVISIVSGVLNVLGGGQGQHRVQVTIRRR